MVKYKKEIKTKPTKFEGNTLKKKIKGNTLKKKKTKLLTVKLKRERERDRKQIVKLKKERERMLLSLKKKEEEIKNKLIQKKQPSLSNLSCFIRKKDRKKGGEEEKTDSDIYIISNVILNKTKRFYRVLMDKVKINIVKLSVNVRLMYDSLINEYLKNTNLIISRIESILHDAYLSTDITEYTALVNKITDDEKAEIILLIEEAYFSYYFLQGVQYWEEYNKRKRAHLINRSKTVNLPALIDEAKMDRHKASKTGNYILASKLGNFVTFMEDYSLDLKKIRYGREELAVNTTDRYTLSYHNAVDYAKDCNRSISDIDEHNYWYEYQLAVILFDDNDGVFDFTTSKCITKSELESKLIRGGEIECKYITDSQNSDLLSQSFKSDTSMESKSPEISVSLDSQLLSESPLSVKSSFSEGSLSEGSLSEGSPSEGSLSEGSLSEGSLSGSKDNSTREIAEIIKGLEMQPLLNLNRLTQETKEEAEGLPHKKGRKPHKKGRKTHKKGKKTSKKGKKTRKKKKKIM